MAVIIFRGLILIPDGVISVELDEVWPPSFPESIEVPRRRFRSNLQVPVAVDESP